MQTLTALKSGIGSGAIALVLAMTGRFQLLTPYLAQI
jgi:hypothetical protein